MALTSPLEEIKGQILSQRNDAIQRRVQVVEGPMPPEVRMSSVTFDGKVSLTFTNEMLVPPNFNDILNTRNKKEVLTVFTNKRSLRAVNETLHQENQNSVI
jgi:hypothetical protein